MKKKSNSKLPVEKSAATSLSIEPGISFTRPEELTGYSYAIIDSLEDELMVIDSHYRIVDANKAVWSKHSKRRDEIIGRPCYEISHGASRPCRRPQHQCPITTVMRSGSAARVNHIHTYEISGEKRERQVDIIVTPVRDRKNNIIAVIELSRDVTEAKQVEAKITNLHRELQHKDEIRGELIGELLSIQEEERKRIAREMHDQTSQVLASLGACIEASIGMLPESAEPAKAMLKKAKGLSARLLDDIHRLIYELRPSLLDDFGLAGALRWLTESSLSGHGIFAQFKILGRQRRLPPQLETTIFRVIQEATTNIIRHAQANNAEIVLRFRKGSVAVSIRDDGKGFSVEEVASLKERPRGLGLLGMKERIERNHGTLDIRSHPGCGTEIEIVVPLEKESV